jgi:predicted XRE-type DNA-binding protein
MVESDDRIIEGSGNVFADLGLKDADELLVRTELTHLIHAELRERRFTSSRAARLLGLEEAEATQLMAGRIVRLTTERLLHLLTALDRDVDIIVRPRPARQSRAKLRVVSAAV